MNGALGELKAAQYELKALRGPLSGHGGQLAAEAVADGGAVVARLDGLDQGQLRELAVAARRPGVRAVVPDGSPGARQGVPGRPSSQGST